MSRRPPLAGKDREDYHLMMDRIIDDAFNLDDRNMMAMQVTDADEEARPLHKRPKHLDARERAVQMRLVDFTRDVLRGIDTQAITEAIPGAEVEEYLRVPGLAALHDAMGVMPDAQTDPVAYQAARAALFAKMPTETLAIEALVFTQPRVNLNCGCTEQLNISRLAMPVQVVRDGDRYYLLTGHHRVVARYATGVPTVPARVCDPARLVEASAVTRQEFRQALYLLMTDQSESERTFSESERLMTLERFVPMR